MSKDVFKLIPETDNKVTGIPGIKLIDITTDNVSELGIYCIKDKKSPGYRAKVEWFKLKINNGLKIKIAVDKQSKQLGFIEYLPSEIAWRPVKATNYLFIQCIAVYVKDAREKGIGSLLLKACEQDARTSKRTGICAMSSDGVWIANKSLYKKNGFVIADRLGRFELMIKAFNQGNSIPKLIDWKKQQKNYKGWNLVYSDQCPWHEKSITDLKQCAQENGIKLKVKKLTTPGQARNAPSGFGTFSLIKDGRLLGDHYLSRKRFENILKQER
jgi:GNAT superfamily N-acetyltransferase